MTRLKWYCVIGVLAVFVPVVRACASSAPTARITAVVLSVEHRVGASGQFSKSKVGTALPAGSRVRTGKRSRCEIRFPDGSIIRMGPTSDVVIQAVADRRVNLQNGNLFAKFVSGSGARIQGGSAVAAIKGTTLEYSTMPNADGTFTDSCTVHETTLGVDFVTSAGITTLMSGFGTSWTGPPIIVTGMRDTDLVDPDPGLADPAATAPPPQPQPPLQFSGGRYNAPWSDLAAGGTQLATPGTDVGLSLLQDNFTAVNAVNTLLPGTFGVDEGELGVIVQSAGLRQGLSASASSRGTSQIVQLAPLFAGAALQQEPVARDVLGRRLFGPYFNNSVFAIAGTKERLAGVRFNPSAVYGKWYVEAGATATYASGSHWNVDLTEAFAAIRPRRSEITVGRQHYLRGPVNNSDLGTVLGFDTYDAVRWQNRINDQWYTDFSMVYDFAPFSKERISGYMVRAERVAAGGVFGANWVHENSRGNARSIDFSLPCVPGVVDVYGEFGKNSNNRNVRTLGVYLPGLYQSHEVDLFVEKASQSGKPGVWSLTAYKEMNEKFTAVAVFHKTSGESAQLAVGGIWRF